MAKKYIFVRMPVETYNRYKEIQEQMVEDVSRIKGKDIKIPMTKVFSSVVSPRINENYIQIDLKKFAKIIEAKGVNV